MTTSSQQGLFLFRNLPWIASWYFGCLGMSATSEIHSHASVWMRIDTFLWFLTEPTQPATIFCEWYDHYWSPVVASCTFQMYICKFGKCQLSFLDGNHTDDKRKNFLSNGHGLVFMNRHWNHDHCFVQTEYCPPTNYLDAISIMRLIRFRKEADLSVKT